MTDPRDGWPDQTIDWDYPSDDDANTAAWQTALSEALTAQTLQLTPDGSTYYELHGDCPRCGHATSQTIPTSVIRGMAEATFNFDCDCGRPHNGRPTSGISSEGCGWGGEIAVTAGGS
jgi:hypothetical protein